MIGSKMKANTRRVLFVDDLLHRWDHFTEMFRNQNTSHVHFQWARDYDEAIHAMKTSKWDVVFLDHDLEDPGEWDAKMGWRDGSAIVDWMRENTPDVGYTVCHSMNPIGRNRMTMCLERGGYPCRSLPFYTFDAMVPAITELISDGHDGIEETDPNEISEF